MPRTKLLMLGALGVAGVQVPARGLTAGQYGARALLRPSLRLRGGGGGAPGSGGGVPGTSVARLGIERPLLQAYYQARARSFAPWPGFLFFMLQVDLAKVM